MICVAHHQLAGTALGRVEKRDAASMLGGRARDMRLLAGKRHLPAPAIGVVDMNDLKMFGCHGHRFARLAGPRIRAFPRVGP